MASSIACIAFNLSLDNSAMSFVRLQGDLGGNRITVDHYGNQQLINGFTQTLRAVIQEMPNSEISTPFCK